MDVAKIGRYQILSEVGRGGMGIVYKAWDPVIERIMALKTFDLTEASGSRVPEDYRKRFLNELKASGKLSHPNIVTVYDAGEDPESGRLFIAMEFLTGTPLDKRLRTSGPLKWDSLLIIALQLGEALEFAHKYGVIHCDIKPANIILTVHDRVKVLDFGVARLVGVQGPLGKKTYLSAPYASPEQIQKKKMDQRSDIYSLGIVLYESITGRRPFPGEDVKTIFKNMLRSEPERPSRVRPGGPVEWDEIVLKMLDKDPDRRFQGADELLESLRRLRDAVERLPRVQAGRQNDDTLQIQRLPSKNMRITIVQGAEEGKSFPIAKEVITIGKRECDINLEDALVSGRHCQLEVFGNKFFIRDLDSKNGTSIGDRRIRLEEIKENQAFQVGKTVFHLSASLPAANGTEEEHPDHPAATDKVPPVQLDELRAGVNTPPDIPPEGRDTLYDVPEKRARSASDSLPANIRFYLEVINGRDEGKVHALSRKKTILGRENCHIQIQDLRASRKHVEIEVRSPSFIYIKDLASTNGTFINGVRISNVQLRDKDVIKIGNTELQFRTSR
jgi:serine/threonine protein kinase